MKFIIIFISLLTIQYIDCVPVDLHSVSNNDAFNQLVNREQRLFQSPLNKRHANHSEMMTMQPDVEWISTSPTKLQRQTGVNNLNRIFDNIFAVIFLFFLFFILFSIKFPFCG